MAESCVFSKQSLGPFHCDPFELNTLVGHPFFRSYGVILPSSFARVLPSACGYSPRPPVSVSGTVTAMTRSEVFPGSMASARLRPEGLPITFQGCLTALRRICLSKPPTRLDRGIQHPAVPSLLRHPITRTPSRWNRNVRLLSFAYASRPPLRDRLTLGGLTFPRNPWAFGEQVFHLLYRYSCRHYLFRFVQPSSRSTFDLLRNAPLPLSRSPY